MEGLDSVASSREILFAVAAIVLLLLGVVRLERLLHRFAQRPPTLAPPVEDRLHYGVRDLPSPKPSGDLP